MNSEFKDIEQLFNENLKNYEEMPPEHVWANIQRKQRRGIFYFMNGYLKSAGVLILLGVIALLSYHWFGQDQPLKEVTETATVTQGSNTHPDRYDTKLETPDNPIMNGDVVSTPGAISQQSASKIKRIKNTYSTGNPAVPKRLNLNENPAQSAEDYVLPNALAPKNTHFRYLIYPSLTPFVYVYRKHSRTAPNHKDKSFDPEPLENRFSMEILGGPSYSSKTLSGEGSELRASSEKAALSLQTAIRLNYHLNRAFMVQSGVIVENRNERVNQTHEVTKDVLVQTPRQVTIHHPVLPPRTITIIDSSYQQTTETKHFHSGNKYTSISIPLVLGYRFALGKAQYRIAAGPLFNVHSIQSANVLTKAGNEVVLTPYRENTRVKTSVYGSASLLIPVSPTLSALIDVSGYRNLSNRLTGETAVKQRNFGLNLSVGAAFELKKQK